MSIKNVFDQIVSFENVLRAEKHTSANRRYSPKILRFWDNLESNLHCLSGRMRDLDFPEVSYWCFYVAQPKLRKIVYTDYATKIIQRSIYDVLNPLICRGFIEDSYSCIEGRGALQAMQRLSKWVDYVSESGRKWYYLKYDVEKFFYRIDHDVLHETIVRKVSDKRTVQMMDYYIYEGSYPFGLPLGVKSPAEVPDNELLYDVGIAIGGGLSHMYGNMVMDRLDHHCKRVLRLPYYIRFMDDGIILHDDLGELHRIHHEIEGFLGDLKLNLNKRTAIRPVQTGIEFVGYSIHPGYVRLRKSTSLQMKRNLKGVAKRYRDYEIELLKARETLMSYKTMMDHCDCRELERKIFEEFVLTHNVKEGANG